MRYVYVAVHGAFILFVRKCRYFSVFTGDCNGWSQMLSNSPTTQPILTWSGAFLVNGYSEVLLGYHLGWMVNKPTFWGSSPLSSSELWHGWGSSLSSVYLSQSLDRYIDDGLDPQPCHNLQDESRDYPWNVGLFTIQPLNTADNLKVLQSILTCFILRSFFPSCPSSSK